MAKIIWMSDPHFQTQGLIDDLNPRTRLRAAIDHMCTHHADADFAIMSGDLAGGDVAGNYAALADILRTSTVPIYPMIGNHDDRAGFRAQLTLPTNAMDDYIQYTIPTPDGLMICLDTHMIGSHAGQFDAERLAWLNQTLTAHANQPVYIFMHHPPMVLGFPTLDEIMLQEGEAFLDLIGAHKNVKHLFMGHVHRPTSGVIRGIPFATIGALSFQAPAPRPAWDWDSFVAPAEAPQYGVLYIKGGDVTLQFTQFCAYDVGIES